MDRALPSKFEQGGISLSYDYRVLSCWLNDVSTKPRYGRRWPDITLDAELVEDYIEFIDTAASWGYNGIVIWGLVINHSWPTDLSRALEPQRKRLVKQILSHAEKAGITVFHGLGAYSWGFEEIIRAQPQLAQGDFIKAWGHTAPHNGDVLCFMQEDSRKWMHRVVDYLVEELDAQAFQLQPFDKGRCMCDRCRQYDDASYFSMLNLDVAAYIKDKWPDKKVAVSGWGMYYTEDSPMESIGNMCSRLDYLSDITDSCLKTGRSFRKRFIHSIPCLFADAAGGSVTPPQTWDRLRWFLPHIAFNGKPIKELYEDGGRAVEVFAGPLNNPGTELSLKALGALLLNPRLSVEQAAEKAVQDVFQPESAALCKDMAVAILQVESVYFNAVALSVDHAPVLERLENVFPGKPVYLTEYAGNKKGLQEYAQALSKTLTLFKSISSHVLNIEKLHRTVIALENTRAELEEVLRGAYD